MAFTCVINFGTVFASQLHQVYYFPLKFYQAIILSVMGRFKRFEAEDSWKSRGLSEMTARWPREHCWGWSFRMKSHILEYWTLLNYLANSSDFLHLANMFHLGYYCLNRDWFSTDLSFSCADLFGVRLDAFGFCSQSQHWLSERLILMLNLPPGRLFGQCLRFQKWVFHH